MQKGTGLKILFVINPISGGKEKTDWENQIRNYFKEAPHNMEFYLLTGKNDAASIQHHIHSVKPDRVVGVGGDGTIKMLAELIQHTQLPLGIIPAGSANGMAKELNIPANLDTALDIAVNGDVKSIDLIKLNNKEICIHLSDIGLNALLVKNFEKGKGRGMWGYGKAVFKVLWHKPLMHLTIKAGDKIVRRKAYMVVLANASKYGTGAIINPTGDVADGKIEAVVIRKLNLIELFKMLVTHQPFHPDRIEVYQAAEINISSKRHAYFQVDGEYRGKIKELKAVVDPGALKVLVPASTGQQ